MLASPTPSSSDPQAKRARRKEARPGELLDAALALFVEKGFAATRVEEVAQRAGVSKGTLFLYFSSKEELFKAVIRTNLSVRVDEWSSEIDQHTGSSADLLLHGMLTWWQRVGNTKASGISKLVMGESDNFPDVAAFYREEVALPYHQLVSRILERGVRSGEFMPMDLDTATYSVTAPLMFLSMWKHSPCIQPAHHAFDPEAYILSHARLILNGMYSPRVRQALPPPS